MNKQDQIIKNLVARTEALGGTHHRTDYTYSGVVSLSLEIGKSHAMVVIGKRGAIQYASTWFEDQYGDWISVPDKKSRPSWARAGELRAWFWNVSRDMHGDEEAMRRVHQFHNTASINFNDKMVAA